MKHKKVELTELFYDLVYVYAISQITSLIHHVHHGVVAPYSLFSFALGLIIFVNSWMVQTVYTNRFGSNSLTNILMMFAQMVPLMISATSISNDWQTSFVPVMTSVAGISALLLVQYLITYFQSSAADKLFIKSFFVILGLRTAILSLTIFLPYRLGLPLAAIGVLATWILPGLLGLRNHEVNAQATQLNFPHLVERLSLLTIIIFGEMLIGIASYFKPSHFSIWSLLIFMIVANLFMTYIVEIDHLIDTSRNELTGNRAIYNHYLVFFGLSFTTVSLSFLGHADADSHFAAIMLYLGIGLVLLGTLLHNSYNKTTHRFDRKLLVSLWGLYLLGLLASFALANPMATTSVTFLATLLIAILLVRHNIGRSRQVA